MGRNTYKWVKWTMEKWWQNLAGMPEDPSYFLDKQAGTGRGQEALLIQLLKERQEQDHVSAGWARVDIKRNTILLLHWQCAYVEGGTGGSHRASGPGDWQRDQWPLLLNSSRSVGTGEQPEPGSEEGNSLSFWATRQIWLPVKEENTEHPESQRRKILPHERTQFSWYKPWGSGSRCSFSSTMFKLQYECPFAGDTNEDLSAGKVLMTSSHQGIPMSRTRPQLLRAVLGVNPSSVPSSGREK